MEKDTIVYSRSKESHGKTTGSVRPCRMEGCRGQCYKVVWPDGKYTWPCGKGMKYNSEDGTYQII